MSTVEPGEEPGNTLAVVFGRVGARGLSLAKPTTDGFTIAEAWRYDLPGVAMICCIMVQRPSSGRGR